METVKVEQKAIPIDVDGILKWCPAVKLGDRDFSPISCQGQILIYDTAEEAEEFFKEED
ncbi:MAG: hypothetical protein ACWA5P_01790 [bacterium]